MNRNLYTIFSLATGMSLLLLLTVFGESGGFLLASLLTGSLALLFLIQYKRPVLGLAIILLGIGPWYWGIDIGKLPKVFVDEMLLLLYTVYFFLSYAALRQKRLFTGDKLTVMSLIIMLCTQSVSFLYNETNYDAVRNYLETYVFGILLYFIFLNETDEKNLGFIVNAIVLTTVLLSIAMLVEWALNYNPVMERAEDMLYLSPQLSRITGNVYRPYATFFHPSESGTFLAMGLPFVYYKAAASRKLWSWEALLVALVLAAIVINYTRGVWLAVWLCAFIYIRQLRRPLLYFTLPAIILGVLIASVFQDAPFARRLFDPTNIIARIFYWDIALDIFKQHPLIGVGHMNFKNVYLDFVRNISSGVEFDIRRVVVPDSLYLSTLVEFGLLGLGSLLAFWSIAITRLRRADVQLKVQLRGPYGDLAACCIQGISIYILAGLLADVHQFTKATKLAFILLGFGFSMMGSAFPNLAGSDKTASPPRGSQAGDQT